MLEMTKRPKRSYADRSCATLATWNSLLFTAFPWSLPRLALSLRSVDCRVFSLPLHFSVSFFQPDGFGRSRAARIRESEFKDAAQKGGAPFVFLELLRPAVAHGPEDCRAVLMPLHFSISFRQQDGSGQLKAARNSESEFKDGVQKGGTSFDVLELLWPASSLPPDNTHANVALQNVQKTRVRPSRKTRVGSPRGYRHPAFLALTTQDQLLT